MHQPGSMLRLTNTLLILGGLCLHAQDSDPATKFIGESNAKFKDKTICTIPLRPGEPIAGQSEDCDISVDANGDLKEPDSARRSEESSPILNPRIQGPTLSFEEKDGDDTLKFEFTILGDGKAELKIVRGAPVAVKPILFLRQ